MFRAWNFLLLEIWALLAIAAVLGIFVGWMIWGRKAARAYAEIGVLKSSRERKIDRIEGLESDIRALKSRYNEGLSRTERLLEEREAHIEGLEAQLSTTDDDHFKDIDALRAAVADRDTRILDLETKLHATPSDALAEIAELKRASADKDRKLRRLEREIGGRTPAANGHDDELRVPPPFLAPEAAVSGMAESPAPFLRHEDPLPDPLPTSLPDSLPDSLAEAVPGTRPAGLPIARGGAPDDLTRISGIGPNLEELCNRLGFFHFDQIASWTDDEVTWVDANLNGFQGRVSRDNWVDQAKALAKADAE